MCVYMAGSWDIGKEIDNLAFIRTLTWLNFWVTEVGFTLLLGGMGISHLPLLLIVGLKTDALWSLLRQVTIGRSRLLPVGAGGWGGHGSVLENYDFPTERVRNSVSHLSNLAFLFKCYLFEKHLSFVWQCPCFTLICTCRFMKRLYLSSQGWKAWELPSFLTFL